MNQPPRRRYRLNQMAFCECRHGQGAHRNGSGPCVGERMVAGVWISCECTCFVREQPEPDSPDSDGTDNP